jgi:hypothetical protein
MSMIGRRYWSRIDWMRRRQFAMVSDLDGEPSSPAQEVPDRVSAEIATAGPST